MGVRRSIVTSVIVFAFTGLFSLLGQGTRGQQPTYKVSGKLVGGPPLFASRFGPTVLFSLNLRPARDDERGVAPVVLRGKLNADGSFEVLNVSPGTYVFMVNPAGAVLRSVPTIVVTNRDVTGLEIPLVLTDVVTNRQNLQTAWSLPGYWSALPHQRMECSLPRRLSTPPRRHLLPQRRCPDISARSITTAQFGGRFQFARLGR